VVVETDLVFTRLDALLCDRLPTGSRVIQFLDDIQYGIHTPNVRVRAVIGAPFLVNSACLEDAWEILVGDTDGRVGLAVLQQYVIARIIFLDERVL
jgi:hypothetical protein